MFAGSFSWFAGGLWTVVSGLGLFVLVCAHLWWFMVIACFSKHVYGCGSNSNIYGLNKYSAKEKIAIMAKKLF